METDTQLTPETEDARPRKRPKTAAELEHIAAQIKALSPARRLLVASQLIEQAKADVDVDCAISIAEGVVLEWQAAKLFGRKP